MSRDEDKHVMITTIIAMAKAGGLDFGDVADVLRVSLCCLRQELPGEDNGASRNGEEFLAWLDGQGATITWDTKKAMRQRGDIPCE